MAENWTKKNTEVKMLGVFDVFVRIILSIQQAHESAE